MRWVFEGRARRIDEPGERGRIYDAIPDLEKGTDPDRRGVAVVIDLDLVTGRDLEMRR